MGSRLPGPRKKSGAGQRKTTTLFAILALAGILSLGAAYYYSHQAGMLPEPMRIRALASKVAPELNEAPIPPKNNKAGGTMTPKSGVGASPNPPASGIRPSDLQPAVPPLPLVDEESIKEASADGAPKASTESEEAKVAEASEPEAVQRVLPEPEKNNVSLSHKDMAADLAEAADSKTAENIKSSVISISLSDDIQLNFLPIPRGDFKMGSPPSEIGRIAADEARHKVMIDYDLWCGQTEVTQEQYTAIMGYNPSYFRFDGDNFSADQMPVEQVTFIELTAEDGFIERLNEFLDDKGYEFTVRLPTEEEWEYFCRAGSSTAFSNNLEMNSRLNAAGLNQIAIYGQLSRPRVVASLEPNDWGLYDCHGNVREWTADGILRGGSYADIAANCRAASKIRGQATSRRPDKRTGFRLVLEKNTDS
jgi:formylglycine-generating enzyme required for sulfatase activity